MAEKLVGKSIKRKEDARFLTGKGTYVDDIHVPHETYAGFVRSQVAHGDIKSIDASGALEMDGVIAVLTGDEMAADGVGPLPCGWMIHSKDGEEMKAPGNPALAVGKVRHVGEPFAIVVAETKDAAKSGAEAVMADIEELPAVADVVDALAEGAPQLHDDVPGNLCYNWALGDGDAADAAIEAAAHVTRLKIRNNRLIPNAIEPRACIAGFDPADSSYTLRVTSQNPHVHRLVLSAFVGLAGEHKITVISPDVGGGFGSKIFIYPEETAALWASKRVGRPVRWTAERSESFLVDRHGRDHATEAELALDADGNFTGLRVKTIANMGAYLSAFASAVPTWLYGTLLAGQYKTPAISVEVDAVFTNTCAVDAYRGAGRPEATYVLERIVEKAARETGRDPAELRRQNFIPTDAFPYDTPVALTYDTGDYDASLTKCLEVADYAGFEARRAEAETRGKLRGIGFSCYIEACGIAPSQVAASLGAGLGLFESARVAVNATGNVQVYVGTHNHGQGHETTFSQIVAERLGISVDDVDIIEGDTSKVQYGLGTYGSRSLAVGGSAIVGALDKIVEKSRKIAAHMMEADVAGVEFEDGIFSDKASNKTITFPEIAFSANVPHNYPLDELEPGLNEGSFYDPANFTYPAGAYLCEVEVDPETGVVDIEAFTAVDDFGRVINPMIVEGQVHGGIAQGVGQAMLENAVYDPQSGQLLTGSFMDYAMPRADDLPNFALEMTETPCTHNPLGSKGCGEAGAIGSPPALINAITNAIGIPDMDMPATPEKVWRACQEASTQGKAN